MSPWATIIAVGWVRWQNTLQDTLPHRPRNLRFSRSRRSCLAWSFPNAPPLRSSPLKVSILLSFTQHRWRSIHRWQLAAAKKTICSGSEAKSVWSISTTSEDPCKSDINDNNFFGCLPWRWSIRLRVLPERPLGLGSFIFSYICHRYGVAKGVCAEGAQSPSTSGICGYSRWWIYLSSPLVW